MFDEIEYIALEMFREIPSVVEEENENVTFEVEVVETVKRVYRVEAPKSEKESVEDYIKNAYYKGRLPEPDGITYEEPEFNTRRVIIFDPADL